jgi:drug/metabolite transporter (DMT)-like permease
MILHRASGHWRRGLTLTLVATLCWATLPIAMKIALVAVDPITLTWVRFLGAAVFTVAWLGFRGGLGGRGKLTRRHWAMLLAAALLLVANYVCFLLGVQHTTPANAQLMIQLAPLLMALGGIWVFGERFRLAQWTGLAVLVTGMALFFADQLATVQAPGYVLGSLLVVIGAIAWAGYAMLQKQLLLQLGSMQILLVIYIVASALLLPFAHPLSLFELTGLQAAMVGFCTLNTIGAYGAFAEALVHWEASRVSAILATTPLLCIGAVATVHAWWPQSLSAETITALGWIGASLVVAGSAAVSLLGRARRA